MWWGKVREACLRPVGDWPTFRQSCLEQLRKDKMVALCPVEHGIVAVFCPSRQAAREWEKRPPEEVFPWGLPHVFVNDTAQLLNMSFEFGSTSYRSLAFVLFCHQRRPMQIQFEL